MHEKISKPRNEIMSNPLYDLDLTSLRYQTYIKSKLAGKLKLTYLSKLFMDEQGLDLLNKAFKNKKGVNFNANHVLLDAIVISKLSQNERITRRNLYDYCLDFDEFIMTICQVANYIKINGLGPKSWVEGPIEVIISQF